MNEATQRGITLHEVIHALELCDAEFRRMGMDERTRQRIAIKAIFARLSRLGGLSVAESLAAAEDAADELIGPRRTEANHADPIP